ncbi:hypothetical protein GCM10028773_00290 [Spirosoma koreense]
MVKRSFLLLTNGDRKLLGSGDDRSRVGLKRLGYKSETKYIASINPKRGSVLPVKWLFETGPQRE